MLTENPFEVNAEDWRLFWVFLDLDVEATRLVRKFIQRQQAERLLIQQKEAEQRAKELEVW